MKTKTHPSIIKKVHEALHGGIVIHHEPTEGNRLGQSGLHTFVLDLMNVIEESGVLFKSHQDTARAIHNFISQHKDN